MSMGDDDSGFQAFKRAALAFHYNARKLTPEDHARLREMAEKLLPRSTEDEKVPKNAV